MLEKIKENWQKKIEKNSVCSTLTHANKKGLKLMRKEGVLFQDLPDKCKVTEQVIFKRSVMPLGDWTRIYPPIENGKINYFNLIFGGKRNLIKLIGILLLVGFVVLQWQSNFATIEYLQNITSTCNVVIPFN